VSADSHTTAHTNRRSETGAGPDRDRIAVLAQIVEAPLFNATVAVLIVANAIVLGLETYPRLRAQAADALATADRALLAVFVVELVLRFASYGRRPLRFFASGWNVFDFAVIGASVLPGLHENVTLLRLLRLARIARLVRVMPELRLLVTAVARSVPGVAGVAVLTALTLYVYGMIGWILFGPSDPERFGDIGKAALTLFILLSLENLPDLVADGMRATALAVPFYVSFVMVAAFLVLNLLIGVIIGSLEEARELEGTRQRAARSHAEGIGPPSPHGAGRDSDGSARAELVEELAQARRALERIERRLGMAHRSAAP